MKLSLTIDKLYNLIKEYHPLYYDNDKRWLEEGYKKCKDMINKTNTIEGNIYAMYYYINKFDNEHFSLRFETKLSILSADIYAMYNIKTKTLDILNSNRKIKLINGKPFIEYLKRFILFSKAGSSILDPYSYIYECVHLFLDLKNPYLEKPNDITLDNDKKIILEYKKWDYKKYKKICNIIYKYVQKTLFSKYKIKKIDDVIYLTIDSFYTIKYNELKKLLPAKKIVVDLRGNLGGYLQKAYEFFKIVYNLEEIRLNTIYKVKGINYKQDCIIPKIDAKEYPKLDILVDELSQSSSSDFCLIAKLLLKNNVKIKGNLIKRKSYGYSSIYIKKKDYSLEIPHKLFNSDDCKKK
jgi:hypothetical protein